ncbi:MAG: RNA polymerase sigma factor [Bacteroidetes bacterium]|nr:RNA polymerase sigma factor [Bacteroidota bacterium]
MPDSSDHIQHDAHAMRREHFLRLLAACRKPLENFAFAMTRDSDEACDLVAETVLLAFEGFETLRDDQAFLAYLFTIASREHSRRRRRARWFGAFDQEKAENIRFAGAMPDVAADVRLLYGAIEKLPARQREALVLFEISGLSLDEIQKIQGGSIGSIKVRLHRARKHLALLLGVDDPPQENQVRSQLIGASHRRRDLRITLDLPVND